MIIPGMTLEEIRKEIEKDYPILLRKMGYVATELGKKLSKEEKRQGNIYFYDYVSKYNNNWIFRIKANKQGPVYNAIMLYHNGRGHVGISSTPEFYITYHTGHFFERYNERRKLGLKSIHEIVCAFLAEVDVFKFQEMDEIDEGIYKIFGMIPSGIVLGMFNKPLMLVKANTFVANETLTLNQKELMVELNESLEKYKDTSGHLN
jgi:hypothetical protein